MAEVALYVGKRGSGKSRRVRRDLCRLPRLVVYDTLLESTYDGLTRVHRFDQLCARLIQNHEYFRIAYHSRDRAIELEEDFERCCEAVSLCRSVCLIAEEVDLFCSPNSIPLPLKNIVTIGRHQDLSLWAVSRRPQDIHPLIRSQANRIVSFTQHEPAAIDWLQQVMGEQAYQLPALKQYHFQTWTDGYRIEGTPPSRILDTRSKKLVG